MTKEFVDFAETLEQVYGTFFDREEGFVICPECEEPIYDCDWAPNHFITDTEGIYRCPVCEETLGE